MQYFFYAQPRVEEQFLSREAAHGGAASSGVGLCPARLPMGIRRNVRAGIKMEYA